MDATAITTEDGKTVHKGDRVFNYYDGVWVTITTDPDSEGWFDCEGDTRRYYLNGSRISSYDPRRTRNV